MKKFLSTVLVTVCALTLTACAQQAKPKTDTQPQTATMNVVASFYPLAEFAQQVGGDKVSVTNLVPPGTEPHDFEPTPKDISTIKAADIFIYNGGGFETWVQKIRESTKSENQIVLEILELKDPELSDPNRNPHLWLDPVFAQQMVKMIRDTFIAKDPDNSLYYTQNATDYIAKLQSLDQKFSAGLKTCSLKSIITAHEAFGALANQYYLTQIAISGLSPEEEPSPKTLAEITAKAKAENIKYIFFETLVSPKLAETIANEIGAQTLVLNPLEGLTPAEIAAGKNYISVMEENLANLRLALNCK